MAARKRPARPRRIPSGQVRIIGGSWRGRKLVVADRPALRPSPDRIRETLFNWLSPYIAGARCLDPFAGTGVLGLEAISRGAAAATLIENDPDVVEQLRHNVAMLDTTAVSIVPGDAAKWLRESPYSPFDIVFLDPPFGQGYLELALEELPQGWLKPRAKVYLEAEKFPIVQLQAPYWRTIREGRTRQIRYGLLEFDEAKSNG